MQSAPRPDLSSGWCARSGSQHWWTSSDREEREAAKHACRACPVLAECESWALTLPTYGNGTAIYAGMTTTERVRRRKQAKAAAARREAQRRYGRNSERLRRQLGKAPTTAQRYTKDPEPFKAQASRYYAEHKEDIRAKRRARHAARKTAAA